MPGVGAPLVTGRRIVALWFPYWAGETTQIPHDKTQSFALIERSKNAQRLVGLTPLAAQQGLSLGLSLADARALLPDLQTAMAEPMEAAARLKNVPIGCNAIPHGWATIRPATPRMVKIPTTAFY
jgi:protein ImuB